MKFVRLTSFLVAGLTMSQAFALPYPQKDIRHLTSKLDMDGIGNIMGDDKNENLLYVFPGNMKVTGQYVASGVVGNCGDLFNLHANVNAMPDQAMAQKIYDEKKYYSALFSITAEEIRNSENAEAISKLKRDHLRLRNENKLLLAEYESTYQALQSIKSDLDTEREVLKTLQTAFFNELATATSETERNQIRENYKEKNREIMVRISSLEQYKRETEGKYNEANKAWAPIKNELDYISKLEESFANSHVLNMKSRKEFYEDSKKMFDQLSTKIVGTASAGYSLNAEERRELLLRRLKEAGLDYSVQPLQIFNVNINQPTSAGAVVQTITSDETVEIGTDVDTGNQVTVGDTEGPVVTGAILEVDGKETPLTWDLKGFSSTIGASGSLEVPISKGTICGTEEVLTKIHSVRNEHGDNVTTTVTHPVLRPADRVLLSKNLPLTFNYYQKAQPLQGMCQIDIDQGSDYIRKHGKKKSGGFFSKKTKKWDDTRIDLKNNMGLTCKLNVNPSGANPKESELIKSAFEKALYQDVFHMFVLSYGKKYQIIQLDQQELGEDSRFFSQIGSGVMNLCGKNKYCELGGIVLKSMDELVGSRHSGSTSHRTSSKGKIKKDYKLSSYLISSGSANVEMKVCLDKNSCN